VPKFQNAFTLIELMTVVIILGIIAGFGIPGYQKTRGRVIEKEGAHSLAVIASAMEMFRLRNPGYPDPPGGANLDVNDINTTLSLGIIEQNINYTCADDDDNTTFTCTADPDDYTWELNISETNDGNPRCSIATCPTCVAGGCPGTI